MIVNKYSKGGGSGSGYTLPIASASILGGVKIGEGVDIDSAGTISVQAGDSHVLLATESIPEGLNDGDVFATSGGVYQLQGEKTEYQWETLEDWSQVPFTQVRVPYAQSAGFAIRYEPTGMTNIDVGFEWNGSTWDTSFNTGTITDGEFSGSENGMTATCVHSGEYLIITFAGWPITFSWNWNNAEAYVAVAVPNYVKVGDGDFIHLDSLNVEGETGKTYEYNGKLMTWNPNSGYIAEWTETIGSSLVKKGVGLIYTTIPNGQSLFKFGTVNGDKREVIMSGGTLYFFSTGGSVVCAVTIDNTFEVSTERYSSFKIIGEYRNGYIGFRTTEDVKFYDVWNGFVNGGHYELVDKYNYPYTEETNGIPSWNKKGQITGKAKEAYQKDIYINTNGYSPVLKVLHNGDVSAPNRIWIPTTSGDEGQVLTSAGASAAPTWATLIKSVKITSDAYAALVQAGTVDPNTLYLIVD